MGILQKTGAIVICLIILVLISCSHQNKVDIDIIEVCASTHKDTDYILDVEYRYTVSNNSDKPLKIYISQVDKIFDPKIEGLNPTEIPVFSNVFVLFMKDTLWGGYGWKFQPYDITLYKSKQYNGFFELDDMLLSQLYENNYKNLYAREKDFILDVVKDGLLCVVVGDSVYKVKNKKPLEYMQEGFER